MNISACVRSSKRSVPTRTLRVSATACYTTKKSNETKPGHRAVHRAYQTVEKPCHSEPVRTLAWESPEFSNIFHVKYADFGIFGGLPHQPAGWFAMTSPFWGFFDTLLSPATVRCAGLIYLIKGSGCRDSSENCVASDTCPGLRGDRSGHSALPHRSFQTWQILQR